MSFTEDPNVFFNVAEHADTATYTPVSGSAFATRVIVDKGVKLFPPDFDSVVVERRTEVTLIASDVPHPRRGDSITVGTKTYKVDEVVADDGFQITVVVK